MSAVAEQLAPRSSRVALRVSNTEFLAHVAKAAPNGAALWVNHFRGNPVPDGSWSGQRYSPEGSDVDTWGRVNTYFSVAALVPDGDGDLFRRKANFARLLVLVVDDPDESRLLSAPSYVLSTSPGKTQVGIFLDEFDPDCADVALLDRLVSVLAAEGLIGGDVSGNNVVRYVRLPVGQNQKPRQEGHFSHVVTQWNPDVRLTLEDAAAVLGIDLDKIRHAGSQPGGESLAVSLPQDDKIRDAARLVMEGHYHEPLNVLGASVVASGMHRGAAVNLLRGLMDASTAPRDQRWFDRYNDIPRSVSTAQEKFGLASDWREAGEASAIRENLPSPIDWAALEADGEPPPREWAIENWLGRSGPSLMAGRGGIGKSLVAHMLGATLALGRDYFGKCNGPLTVLYWSCEDEADECRRIAWANASALNVPVSAFARLHVVSRVGLDNTLVQYEFGKPMYGAALEQLRQQAEDVQADVVILDNVAHMFGGSGGSRREVTHFVNTVAALHGGRKVSTLFLHHTSKASGSEYADSAAWENAVRMRWWLTDKLPDRPDDEDDGGRADSGMRYLARRKANYSGQDVRRMYFQNGAMLAEPTDSGVLDVGLLRSINARTAETAVLTGMRRCAEMKVHVTDGQSSPGFLPKVLIQFQLAGDLTKRDLDQAMRRLMAAGTIRREVVGAYANRNQKFGLVIVEGA